MDATKQVIGYKRNKNKEWLSEETWLKISERREINKKILNERDTNKIEVLRKTYELKNKEVKKHARKDKRDYMNNLAEEAEMAANTFDSKKLYQITKKNWKKGTKK